MAVVIATAAATAATEAGVVAEAERVAAAGPAAEGLGWQTVPVAAAQPEPAPAAPSGQGSRWLERGAVLNGASSLGQPLNRVHLPTLGMPTMPICKAKRGRPEYEGTRWGAQRPQGAKRGWAAVWERPSSISTPPLKKCSYPASSHQIFRCIYR